MIGDSSDRMVVLAETEALLDTVLPFGLIPSRLATGELHLKQSPTRRWNYKSVATLEQSPMEVLPLRPDATTLYVAGLGLRSVAPG